QLSRRIVTRLDRVQYVVAELRLFRIHRTVRITLAIEETDARVKIPAVVIKWIVFGERSIERLDRFEILLLDVNKTHDDVGNLHTSVVDVVLDFDSIAGCGQNANKRVAKHGISHVANVRGFIWIDTGVLDHLF